MFLDVRRDQYNIFGLTSETQHGISRKPRMPHFVTASHIDIEGLQSVIGMCDAVTQIVLSLLPIKVSCMQADRSNITRARALFELALEADPHHLQSLLGLGALEARAGSGDRGLRLLQEGLRLQPDNKQIRHALAQWQRKNGDREVSCVQPAVSHTLWMWSSFVTCCRSPE